MVLAMQAALPHVERREPLPVGIWRALHENVKNLVLSKQIASHPKAATLALFSPDGEMVLSGGRDGSVRLWNRESFSLEPAHGAEVVAGSISADGARAATASDDDTVIVWDLRARKRLTVLHARKGSPLQAELSPSGKLVAITQEGSSAIELHHADGTHFRTLAAGRDPVKEAHFSKDGATLIGAGEVRTAHVWSVATGELLRTISVPPSGPMDPALEMGTQEERDGIWHARFGSEPDELVAASRSQVVVWPARGAPRSFSTTTLLGLVDSSATHVAAAVVLSSEFYLWRRSDGERLLSYSGGYPISALELSRDGTLLLTVGHGEDLVRVWDVARGSLAFTLESHGIAGAQFSPRGDRIISFGDDGDVRLWELKSGAGRPTIRGLGEDSRFALSHDGKTIAVGSAKTVRFWDLSSLRPLPVTMVSDRPIWSLAFSGNDRSLLTTGEELATVWDVASGRLRRTESMVGRNSPSLSVDGRYLLVSEVTPHPGTTRGVTQWEVESGDVRCHISDKGSDGAYSADGERILVQAAKELSVWRADTCALLWRHAAEPSYASRFSPNGGVIVSGGGGGTLLWDRESGALLRTIEGEPGDFTPDGDHLFTTTREQRRLWSLTASDRPLVFPVPQWATMDGSRDGSWLVSSERGGMFVDNEEVTLWNARTGEKWLPFNLSKGGTLRFTRDSRFLVVRSDGELSLWPLSERWMFEFGCKVIREVASLPGVDDLGALREACEQLGSG
jgi:WD40 repeat protein